MKVVEVEGVGFPPGPRSDTRCCSPLRRLALIASLGAALTACEQGGARVTGDAGTGDARIGSHAPTSPTPPTMTPCPAGWSERTDRDSTFCEPPPRVTRLCGPGGGQFLGEAECVAVGSACPEDGFPSGLTGEVVYVRPGARSGDGSRARPLGLIRDAVRQAAAGTTIALSVGTYDEHVELDKSVQLVGACPERTFIRHDVTSASDVGLLMVRRGEVTVRDITFGAAENTGVVVWREAVAHLDGVVIQEVEYAGLWAHGGRIDGQNVVIDTVRATGEGNGQGLIAQDSGSITLTDVVVDRATTYALLSSGENTAVSLTKAVLRRTRVNGDGTGYAVSAERQSRVTISEALISDNVEVAVATTGLGSVGLEDVVIQNVRSAPGSSASAGLSATRGTILGRRILIRDVQGSVGVVLDSGSMTLEHAVLREIVDASLGPDLPVGFGFGTDTGTLTLRNVDIAGVPHYAIAATRGELNINDVTVHDVRPWDGFGMTLIVRESRTRVARLSIVDAIGAGIRIYESPDVELSDVVVNNTTAAANSDEWGRAFSVGLGSRVALQRAMFGGAADAQIYVSGGSHLTASDVTVTNTRARPCAASTCRSEPAGFGVALVGEGTQLDLREFDIDDSALCGVLVDIGALAKLGRGQIRRSSVGTCIRASDYDVTTVTRDVVYRDNGVNVDTVSVAIPGELPPIR